MTKIRVAVIGYGHLGKWHCQKAEAFPEAAQLVAIVERFPANQEAAQKNHPTAKIVSDISEVIDDIDAAFVVTPTSTHFELVKYLLQNRKHVFCEKPLCSNDDEAKKLLEFAEDSTLVLQVGQSERFHEAWEILRDRLQSLPTPFTVRINRAAPFKGRATDVDVVQDLAIHDLDLVNFLFRQKPLEIQARGQRIRTSNWDHANIRVQLEENCDVEIMVGRNHVKEMRDLEVISRDGMIYVDLFNNKILEASSSQFEDGSFVKETSYNKRDHLLLEHRYFYDSISAKRAAIVDMSAGLRAVHLVDVALRAMRDGGIVRVQFDG